jgi:hypothetical protein
VSGPLVGVSVVGVSVVRDELPGRVIVTDPHAARASAIARTVAPRSVEPGTVARGRVGMRRDDIRGKATPGFCEADVNPPLITLGQRDGYERRACVP